MTKLKQFCSVRIEMYQSQICEPEDTWPNSVGSLSVMYLIGTRICNHAEATRFGSLFSSCLGKRGQSPDWPMAGVNGAEKPTNTTTAST